MSQQASWVSVPKRRVKPAKLPAAIENANRLIDWYQQNKPDVARLAVTAADYKAFAQGVDTYGITKSEEGPRYRGFLIYVAP